MKSVDVAIGIILRGDKLLICRRRQTGALAGYWEFPGGKCEAGESPLACLKRELREELAIGAVPIHSFATIEHRYPTIDVRLHPFLCHHDGGDPQPLACDELRWITAAELRDYRFPEANGALIEQIVEKLGSGTLPARNDRFGYLGLISLPPIRRVIVDQRGSKELPIASGD